MLSKPTVTLLGACLFAGSVIYLVHHSQKVDRKVSFITRISPHLSSFYVARIDISKCISVWRGTWRNKNEEWKI